MPAPDALVAAVGAGMVYPGAVPVVALADISLEAFAGDLAVVAGPSGSGKATLLSVLGLLDQPTSGVVFALGRPVSDLPEEQRCRVRRDLIGFVFQQFHLIGHLDVLANVELAIRFRGIGRIERRQRALAALERVGLAALATRVPAQLSGGEQQRVAIARAVVSEPRVVLADEPTGNLDSRNARVVLEYLERLALQGVAVVVATHDPSVVARATWSVVLHDGRLVDSR